MTATIRPLVRGARRRDHVVSTSVWRDAGTPSQHLLVPIRDLSPGEIIRQVSAEVVSFVAGGEVAVELVRMTADFDAWIERREAKVLTEEVIAREIATASPDGRSIEIVLAGLAEEVGDGRTMIRTHFLRVFGVTFVSRLTTWFTG